MENDLGFAFKIGDYVTLKAHVDLYGLEQCQPMVVRIRLSDECYGGVQRHYRCRVVQPPRDGGWRRTAGAASFSGAEADGLFHIGEPELIALDIEAYKAARVDPLDEARAALQQKQVIQTK